MKNAGTLKAAAAAGLACAFVPALAQDNDSGLRMTLGVDQRFEAGENLALENPEQGTTALATTTLSFDLFSQTRTQTLAFGIEGKLRGGETPAASDIGTGFVEPRLSLSYTRESARARLSFDGNYRESDVSFLPPLSSFTDPTTGQIELPPDFEDLRNTGTRQAYDLSTRLETGIDAPLGFVFDAKAGGINYADGASANLDDVFRYSYGVEARMRLSQVLTGFVGYDWRHFESDDLQNTERETNAIEFGATYDISDRASIEAAIGYSETDETLFGNTTTEDGLTARLAYDLDMPNGTITANYDRSVDQDGNRQNLRFGRALDLPRGGVSFSAGATQKGSGTPRFIGSLNWQHELPSGGISVGFNRNVSLDEDDNERISTVLNLNYIYEINQLSSLGFDAVFGLTEDNATNNDTQRGEVSASYNYALTPDWNLSTGVSYRVRDEDAVGQSDSASVFVNIGRDFTFFR